MAAPVTRRRMLATLGGGFAALALPPAVEAAHADEPGAERRIFRLGATWRGPRADSTPYAGVLRLDREAATLEQAWSAALPGRAHGLFEEADGSLLVVAVRPGTWLQRFDAEGRPVARLDLDPGAARHLTGHVVASPDGQWLYTGETDPRDDSGWVAVRERASLREVAAWPTHGIEPHQLLVDPSGVLLVANGGIRRTRGDRKRDLDRMQSSLVQLDPRNGERLGQWRLDDARLSLRHLAWSAPASDGGPPLLGIALQAEHDDRDRRRQAPVLAVWDGRGLRVPSHAADAVGYAGDIAAAPGGGFLISSHRVDSALWWHPSQPGRLRQVAKLTEAYALGAAGDGDRSGVVAIAAARGAALWHPTRPATLLPWPEPMALDNHWIVLGATSGESAPGTPDNFPHFTSRR